MKYRLRPLECGAYILEQNNPLMDLSGNWRDSWVSVSCRKFKTLEEAQEIINNLKRPVIYIDINPEGKQCQTE